MKLNDADVEVPPVSRTVIISAGLAIVSVTLLILAIFLLVKFSYSYSPIEFSSVNQQGVAASSNKPIIVEISGAVVHPGVYRMEEGARVDDLLKIAGGVSNDVDDIWIEKTINRASRVTDGMKLYIRRKGEDQTSHNVKVVSGVDVTSYNNSNEQKEVSGLSVISINLASQTELESLPGIGPVTAIAIIKNRPYSSFTELVEKKIVKPAVYEKIKEMISL